MMSSKSQISSARLEHSAIVRAPLSSARARDVPAASSAAPRSGSHAPSSSSACRTPAGYRAGHHAGNSRPPGGAPGCRGLPPASAPRASASLPAGSGRARTGCRLHRAAQPYGHVSCRAARGIKPRPRALRARAPVIGAGDEQGIQSVHRSHGPDAPMALSRWARPARPTGDGTHATETDHSMQRTAEPLKPCRLRSFGFPGVCRCPASRTFRYASPVGRSAPRSGMSMLLDSALPAALMNTW
jgi:hypothetical protein